MFMALSTAEEIGYGVSPLKTNHSSNFAEFCAATTFDQLPDTVRHEAKRGIIDWFGCAIAGSQHATIDLLMKGLSNFGSARTVPVIGRRERLGPLEAAMANGQIGHVLDFDDTHMDGVVLHTSSPVLAALISTSHLSAASGRDLMTAYALGFEAGVRVGKSAPNHHDGGWHLTGTLGSIAAGIAAARLLKLDARQTVHALGIATTQAAGMQQNRGTMCKSFHAGRAASSGVIAAVLARQGFDSSEEIVEGKKGFSRTYSATTDIAAFTSDLGDRWEILSNGYKPYACGVVLHPLIDGVIELSRCGIDPAKIAEIRLRVHPHAIRITGVLDPQTGLQSKFSLYHSAAVAFLDQAAGLSQYSDERAKAPEVVSLRGLVSAYADEAYRRDEAHVTVVTHDGGVHEQHVHHAKGTRANPMSDDTLGEKFLANSVPILGEERARFLLAAIWRLEDQADINELFALAHGRE